MKFEKLIESTLFQVRACFRLSKIEKWEDINPALFTEQPDLIVKLKKAYGDTVDNVDLYIGGMLESTDGPGELFTAIILDQFTRLRDSDRFWFENTESG